MTDLEAIEKVIADLEAISVPVSLMKQIGIPIVRSTNLLRDLYAAMVQSAQEKPVDNPEEIKMETEPVKEEGEANE